MTVAGGLYFRRTGIPPVRKESSMTLRKRVTRILVAGAVVAGGFTAASWFPASWFPASSAPASVQAAGTGTDVWDF
jgi:hypothetical protein